MSAPAFVAGSEQGYDDAAAGSAKKVVVGDLSQRHNAFLRQTCYGIFTGISRILCKFVIGTKWVWY